MLTIIGAGAFGALIGWFVYYINRYRKGDVQFSDLTTLVGIIGGGSVLTMFDGGSAANAVPKQVLFGAYGLGLFIGFFAYFIVLLLLVKNSGDVFAWTWFLDGRRKNPKEDEGYAGGSVTPNTPMEVRPLGERVAVLEEQSRQREDLTASAHLAAEESVHTFRRSETTPRVMETVDPTAAKIIDQCSQNWDANKNDCNKFVLAVAQALGVTGLQAPANTIVDTITSAEGWRQLSDGVEAKEAADAGEFVIGGLRGSEQTPAVTHGHVVIVVSGGLAQEKYPTAFWGTLGGTGEKNKTINWAWKKADRDKVHYASRKLA